MTATDLTFETAWTSTNDGLEYTARMPFSHPRLQSGDLTILVVCEGCPFTSADRRSAQRRFDHLGEALEGLIQEAAGLLAGGDTPALPKEPMAATLMLTAGNAERWTIALDSLCNDATLFVECVDGAVLRAWLAD